MTSDRLRTSRVIALLLIVGAFFTAEEVFMDLAGQRPQLTGRDVMNGVVFWAVWAVLIPLVLVAVRRWPLDTAMTLRPLLANIIAALLLAAVHNVISSGLSILVAHRTYSPAQVLVAMSGTAFVWGLFTGVVFYSVIVMVDTAVRFRRLYVTEQLSAAALKQELTQSQLDTLRSQLRPHFLFNTLNAISVFVKEDADKAQQLILRLSSLLRRSLDEDAHEVPLEQELAFVTDYLEIQRGRFGDRLAVTVDVDASVLRAYVPVFLLQPLLENAIEHGTSPDCCTTVVLRAVRDREMLELTLADDGPGMADGRAVRERIGLTNTRERLRHLYGPRATIELGASHHNGVASGARVEVRIPFRNASV